MEMVIHLIKLCTRALNASIDTASEFAQGFLDLGARIRLGG